MISEKEYKEISRSYTNDILDEIEKLYFLANKFRKIYEYEKNEMLIGAWNKVIQDNVLVELNYLMDVIRQVMNMHDLNFNEALLLARNSVDEYIEREEKINVKRG